MIHRFHQQTSRINNVSPGDLRVRNEQLQPVQTYSYNILYEMLNTVWTGSPRCPLLELVYLEVWTAWHLDL